MDSGNKATEVRVFPHNQITQLTRVTTLTKLFILLTRTTPSMIDCGCFLKFEVVQIHLKL